MSRFNARDAASFLDPFCQLENRTALRMRVQQALAEVTEGGSAGFLMLVLGLDSLKAVNAHYGMSTGDAYLFAWAQRLRRIVSTSGRCYYVFGAHFSVLLPYSNEADEESLIQTLQQWHHALVQPFELAEKRLDVALTIGVARAPHDGRDFDDLFANASAARQEARGLGADDVVICSPKMHLAQESQLDLVSDLSVAIENNELFLHYQPTVDPCSKRIVGLEALIRWNHPKRGLVSPLDFIPTAESTGLIHEIGRWTFTQVVQDRREWQKLRGADARFAFNVSPREISEKGFVEGLDRICAAAEVEPSQFEIELTENIMLQYPERSARILRNLRRRGFSIAIDDFGSGYASLLYLQRFPVDKIKIDRHYIDGVVGQSRERAVVVAAIQLAHDLSSAVVAEGVETQAQVDALIELGCRKMQGYHFCRPMLLSDLMCWAEEFEQLPCTS